MLINVIVFHLHRHDGQQTIRRREEERGLAHNGGKGVAAVAVAEDISYLVTILEKSFPGFPFIVYVSGLCSGDLVSDDTAAASSRTTGTSRGAF